MRQLEQAVHDLKLSARTPGFQYRAVDASSTLVELSAGHARLDGSPMTSETTMMAYSMSKPITAAAVLQLVDRGRIDIDAQVSRYLPWQPYGDQVTVRRLLSHTAGLPNPIPLRWVHSADEQARFDENQVFRRILLKHGRLVARPGTRFVYSNIGYWLLGRLVERVTGEPFTSYVENHVFAPLGLNRKEMGYAITEPRRHATGYLERFSFSNLLKPLLFDRRLIGEPSGRWVAIRPHYVDGPAFGGVVGTAHAFGLFLQDQLRDEWKLFGKSAQRYFTEPQRTQSGAIPMTLGWHIDSLDREPYFFKEGGGGGFHCLMRLYRSARIGTVLMTNATLVDVRRLLDRLDGLILSR